LPEGSEMTAQGEELRNRLRSASEQIKIAQKIKFRRCRNMRSFRGLDLPDLTWQNQQHHLGPKAKEILC
jgi:hypothetical protein